MDDATTTHGPIEVTPRLRALIYCQAVPETDRLIEECTRYCEMRGYDVVMVIVDHEGGQRWDDVFARQRNGEFEVAVLPSRSHLPADRVPRIEIVAEERRRSRLSLPRILGAGRGRVDERRRRETPGR